MLGGTLGWLIGIGALTIPGLGPFVAAGPIMAALAGVGVGGTVGGFAGALFVPFLAFFMLIQKDKVVPDSSATSWPHERSG